VFVCVSFLALARPGELRGRGSIVRRGKGIAFWVRPGLGAQLPQTIFNLEQPDGYHNFGMVAAVANWQRPDGGKPALGAPLRSPETLDEFRSGIVTASRHLRRRGLQDRRP